MSTVKISDSGGREVSVTTDKALKVDGSGVTQPISLTAGNNVIGQVKLTDGTDIADVLDLANSNPIAVAIVDTNGDQIASFGGGVQYTEGDTDATITGTATMMEVAANTLQPIQGTVADGLLVNLGANNDVTVTGVSTAANQTTIIGHVDGIEGLLTTIDSDTGNISTKIDAIAGAVSGTEMQVDVLTLPAIPTGTNVIGSVKITDGVDTLDIIDSGTYTGVGAYILDGSGNPITSFGGGTEYTEGDVDASITGNVVLMEVAANTVQPIQGTIADGLLVNLGSNNDVVVTGSVTANAGTNLNTSLLALESGGNIASIKAKTDNIPALGQALASASVPVVLTAAQISTLTPPASISGFATEATLATIDADTSNISTKIDTIAGAISGTEMQVDVLTMPTITVNTHAVTATDLDIRNLVNTDVVTAELSAVDNAVLDAIAASVAAIDTDTSTIIGHVDGIETLIGTTNTTLTTIDGRVDGLEASSSAIQTAVQLIDDTVFTDDTSTHSTGSTKGLGVMAVANPTDSAIDANDIGMLAMTLARALKIDLTTIAGTAIDANSGNKSAGTQRVILATDQVQLTTPLNVTLQSGATGGDTVFHLASAGSTNATNIKASAGKVTGWYIYNSNAAARKVAFHNTAGTPTAGASVYFSLMIPPSSGANVSFPVGLDFSTGIGITTVTGLADSDSAAVAANDLIINIYYK